MQRRLAFPQALAHSPGLLELDEPTSGVDALPGPACGTSSGTPPRPAPACSSRHSMEEAQECERLVMLAAGRRVAAGTVADIVGSAEVTTVDWAAAFGLLEAAGLRAALVGRSLRVPSATAEQVREALAGLPAALGRTAATLEERFLELAVGTSPPAGGT